MKAALITDINKLEIREMPDPVVPEGGVLVRMKAASLCGTDVKMISNGHRDLTFPRIPGHEGYGVIEESRSPEFRKGDIAAVYPGIFCGKCSACLSGHTSRCESINIYGFNRDGLFRSLVPFSKDELSSLCAVTQSSGNCFLALAEPLACCISGYEKISVEKNAALIVGAGSAGSIFSALLLSEGFKKVVIADREKVRLDSMLPDGVEIIESPVSSLDRVLRGKSFESAFNLIIPCCPEGLLFDFWKFMKPGGAALFFSGNAQGLKDRPIDRNEIHYKELVLAGSYGCSIKDFKKAIDMIGRERVDLSFIRPSAISIDQLPGFIQRYHDKKIKKIIIDRF